MRTAILTALALAASSCASSKPAERETSAAQATATRPAGKAMHCPMAVPGTTVSAQDTAAGESLTFTTKSGDVEDLRRRVHAMAAMHNGHHGTGGPQAGTGQGGMMQGEGGGGAMAHGHGHGHGKMHGAGGMMMPPPSRASVEDVDGGARIDLVPLDPARAEQLRTAVRGHAEHMQKEGCPGMMGRISG